MAKKKVEKEKQWFENGCDFCMQFDYDEPHVIGASPDSHGGIELVIKAYADAGITFVCPTTGKKMRIFAMPLSDKGRIILDEQPQAK